jgi:hypothetical protein
MEPPQDRFVQSASAVRGEDGKASGILDSLQKIIEFDVGVAVMAILHLGAFAKKPVCFVEQEDRATPLRRIEDLTPFPFSGGLEVFDPSDP